MALHNLLLLCWQEADAVAGAEPSADGAEPAATSATAAETAADHPGSAATNEEAGGQPSHTVPSHGRRTSRNTRQKVRVSIEALYVQSNRCIMPFQN